MLLVRFLFGVAEAGAYPNLVKVVGDWFPLRERAVSLGAIWMAARLGGAVAPLVLGRLSSLLGWRVAFGVLGLCGVAWAVFWHRWFRNRPEEMPACNEAERELIRGGSSPAVAHGPLLNGPFLRALAGSLTVWAVGSVAFLVTFAWYFYPTWQPKYLEAVHHFKPSDSLSELLTGLPFLFGAVGSLAGGRLSDVLVRRLGRRWGRSLPGLVGFGGAGVCALLTGLTTSPWQAVALLCLASLVNDLGIPAIWAACADIAGPHTGTVSGLMNMVGGLGAILCPILIPIITENLSGLPPDQRWQVIFTGLAGAWFLAAVSALFIDAGRRLALPSGGRDQESGVRIGSSDA
jgi:MFS family permease